MYFKVRLRKGDLPKAMRMSVPQTRITARVDSQLVENFKQVLKERRWDVPEITGTQGRFIEFCIGVGLQVLDQLADPIVHEQWLNKEGQKGTKRL